MAVSVEPRSFATIFDPFRGFRFRFTGVLISRIIVEFIELTKDCVKFEVGGNFTYPSVKKCKPFRIDRVGTDMGHAGPRPSFDMR